MRTRALLGLVTLVLLTVPVAFAQDHQLHRMRAAGDKLLKEPLLSVVHKTQAPPSGDKHDFLGLGRYLWPNPHTPDGLPWISKDGQVNPEMDTIPDPKHLGTLAHHVETLALAYRLTREEQYAVKATQFIAGWFVDPATKMNAHLEYAATWPGKKPAFTGVLVGQAFCRVLDGVEWLRGSMAWSPAHQEALQAWFEKYYYWLTSSEAGRKESKEPNNHGTWYDVQASCIALYVGKVGDAKQIFEQAKTRRIAAQIAPDGQQPEETHRSRSLSYSVYNLQAYFKLAAQAAKTGVDLWHYQTADGRSIRRAFDYVLPAAVGETPWLYDQRDPFDADKQMAMLLVPATKIWQDARYEAALRKLPDNWQKFFALRAGF